ncbi:MAG: type I-C CRISPR-associated protein Cas8c/Csd1, partial [Caldilinea sp.]
MEIASFGYSKIGINFALNLSGQGELLDLLPLFVSEMRGKKRVDVPLPMMVPQQNKRTSKIEPNFLWDQSAYVLGISGQDKEQPSYSADRFKAFRDFHRKFLADVNSQVARAVLAFLDRYDQAMLCEHPAVQIHSDALATGVNLVFWVEGVFAHLDPTIRSAWEQTKSAYTGTSMQCLVTGEQGVVARLHQAIKGVRNAQPSGATLVGFNADAYESYGRSQGLIAPVGEAATAAYSTVLNHLLSNANPNKKIFLGDTTVVYWAESANRTYETVFAGIVDPDLLGGEGGSEHRGRYRVEALMKVLSEKIQQAGSFDLDMAMADLRDENPRFYILGLAPNVSRLSVRFFVQDLFEEVVKN